MREYLTLRRPVGGDNWAAGVQPVWSPVETLTVSSTTAPLHTPTKSWLRRQRRRARQSPLSNDVRCDCGTSGSDWNTPNSYVGDSIEDIYEALDYFGRDDSAVVQHVVARTLSDSLELDVGLTAEVYHSSLTVSSLQPDVGLIAEENHCSPKSASLPRKITFHLDFFIRHFESDCDTVMPGDDHIASDRSDDNLYITAKQPIDVRTLSDTLEPVVGNFESDCVIVKPGDDHITSGHSDENLCLLAKQPADVPILSDTLDTVVGHFESDCVTVKPGDVPITSGLSDENMCLLPGDDHITSDLSEDNLCIMAKLPADVHTHSDTWLPVVGHIESATVKPGDEHITSGRSDDNLSISAKQPADIPTLSAPVVDHIVSDCIAVKPGDDHVTSGLSDENICITAKQPADERTLSDTWTPVVGHIESVTVKPGDYHTTSGCSDENLRISAKQPTDVPTLSETVVGHIGSDCFTAKPGDDHITSGIGYASALGFLSAELADTWNAVYKLPVPWKTVHDPNTDRFYYWNLMTNEVTWTPPHQDKCEPTQPARCDVVECRDEAGLALVSDTSDGVYAAGATPGAVIGPVRGGARISPSRDWAAPGAVIGPVRGGARCSSVHGSGDFASGGSPACGARSTIASGSCAAPGATPLSARISATRIRRWQQ